MRIGTFLGSLWVVMLLACDSLGPANETARRQLLRNAFIATYAGIFHLDLDSKQVTPAMELFNSADVAIDPVEKKLYWSDGLDRISRINVDGTNFEVVVSGLERPTFLDLNTQSRRLYWYSSDTNTVSRSNLDGIDIEQVVGNVHALDIAVHEEEGYVYWTAHHELKRTNMADDSAETLDSAFAEMMGPVTLDYSAGKIYWDTGSGIKRSNLDGSELEYFTDSTGRLTGMAIDSLNRNIYWTGRGTILCKALAGQEVTELIRNRHPGSIAIDPTTQHLYWNEFNSLLGANTADLEPYSIAIGPQVPNGIACDARRRVLYWTEQDRAHIRSLDLKSNLVRDAVHAEKHIHDVEYEPNTKKLYWATVDAIQRNNVDGSEIEAVVTGEQFTKVYPVDIALHPDGRTVFWLTKQHIMVANVDGSNVHEIIDDLIDPKNLSIDATTSSAYWVSPRSSSIQRVKLDGSRHEVIYISRAMLPTAIVVGLRDHHLYWTANNSLF